MSYFKKLRVRPRRDRALRFERLEERLALSASYVEITPAFDVAVERFDDGNVARVEVRSYADAPVALWTLDWGDGEVDQLEQLGDRVALAHYYPESADDLEYRVTLSVVDALDRRSAEPCELTTISVKGTLEKPNVFIVDAFADAEKSSYTESRLCWGAAAANVLYYTGWANSSSLVDAGGASVAFEDEDDVYEYVVANFDNMGSSALYGYQWFITGDYDAYGVIGWAQPELGSGGFYRAQGVTLDDVADYYAYANEEDPKMLFANAVNALRDGGGVCLALAYYSSVPGSLVTQAHTISLWGYEYDPTYSPDDPRYYTALVVSDSDDDEYLGRGADNVLLTIKIEWSAKYGRYRLTDYYGGECWLEELITLKAKDAVLG